MLMKLIISRKCVIVKYLLKKPLSCENIPKKIAKIGKINNLEIARKTEKIKHCRLGIKHNR